MKSTSLTNHFSERLVERYGINVDKDKSIRNELTSAVKDAELFCKLEPKIKRHKLNTQIIRIFLRKRNIFIYAIHNYKDNVLITALSAEAAWSLKHNIHESNLPRSSRKGHLVGNKRGRSRSSRSKRKKKHY